jgi:hypothetical protein
MSLFDLRVIWIANNLKPASRRLCDMRICERYKPPCQKTYLLLSAWECKEHILLNHFPTAMKPTESFPGPRVVLINRSDGKDEGTFSRGFVANMIRCFMVNQYEMRIPGYPRTPKMSLYNFPRLQWFLQHHSSWKQSDLSNGGPSHPHPCKVSTTIASCVCATGMTLDLDINLDTTVSLWICGSNIGYLHIW